MKRKSKIHNILAAILIAIKNAIFINFKPNLGYIFIKMMYVFECEEFQF